MVWVGGWRPLCHTVHVSQGCWEISLKVALLADVHGNADALAAVLAAARRENVRRLLVAGDLVGYYRHPGLVLELLDEWSWAAVRGNHEERLAARLAAGDWDDERQKYGSGLEVAGQLPEQDLQRLLALEHPLRLDIDGRAVLLCHGAPWSVDEYVYPDAVAEVRDRMARWAAQCDLLVHGHTHYANVWREDRLLIVNPGSVGQPRDRRPGASWALWDTREHTVVLRREPYDNERIRAESRRNDPHLPYLWEVLVRQ